MWSSLGLSGLFLASYLAARTDMSSEDIAIALLLAIPLIWLSVIDLDRFVIPDISIIWIVLSGLAIQLQLGTLNAGTYLFEGLLTFVFMYAFSELARKWLQKTALGFGDVKLLGASAIWIGAMGISSAILLASVAGILFAAIMWLLKKRRIDAPVPFGPFIAFGVWAVWLFGPLI